MESNKNADTGWFRLESCKENDGTSKISNMSLTFLSHILLLLQKLQSLNCMGNKVYIGGKICLADHFKPLWARNVPECGLAHLRAPGSRAGRGDS